jgi:hypothetical protein
VPTLAAIHQLIGRFRGLSQRRAGTRLKFARSASGYRSRKADEDAAVLARMGELALAYLCTALNGRSVADTVAKHFGAGCVRFVPQTNMTSPRNRGEVKTALAARRRTLG